MFWTLLIAIGLAWIVQSWLSFKQTKQFTRLFVELRRKGRVAMGKYRGGVTAGSIVMFVLDEDDRILEGHRLRGVTVLARFQPFNDYDGQFVSMIDPQTAAGYGKSMVKALVNLKHNYQIVSGGGTPAEPLTAVGRVLDKLPGFKAKQRVHATPGRSGVHHRKKKVVTRARASA